MSIELIDGFEIDISAEFMEACCYDDCTNTPTFRCTVVFEEKKVGETFICKIHYKDACEFPVYFLLHSRVVRALCGYK